LAKAARGPWNDHCFSRFAFGRPMNGIPPMGELCVNK
jgi:hypothetical protein